MLHRTPKRKNKGEIAELHAILYILANNNVPLVDSDLKELDKSMTFTKILRNESYKTSSLKKEIWNEYVLDIMNDDVKLNILSQESSNVTELSINKNAIKKLDNELKALILHSNTAIVDNNEIIIAIKELLHTNYLIARANDKADFFADVLLEDKVFHKVAFSIKSQTGGGATLINSNGVQSAFKYRLTYNNNEVKSKQTIANLMSLSQKDSSLIKKLLQDGYKLEFDKVKGHILEQNLRFLDDYCVEIIAALMIERYKLKYLNTPLIEIIDHLCEDKNLALYPFLNTLAQDYNSRKIAIISKIQKVLLGFFTDVTVSKLWTGKLSKIETGLIITDRKADVISIQAITSEEELSLYLIKNTYFESPSKKRHSHSKLYFDEDSLCIDLQLQVRFKN